MADDRIARLILEIAREIKARAEMNGRFGMTALGILQQFGRKDIELMGQVRFGWQITRPYVRSKNAR
ncbi:hypothetical protein QDX27_10525 [Rhizobium sp. BR 318]|uniref:Uncharacterized protein n=1 Tax=Rhizobium paranaense TaxID=1650438 RepID=A0A7W9D167_9HYPH|nr:hypothetical protein [Rhizobium sp. SEMIA4064]MBB5573755.1 hypothetical protein [Rhizobium paranaense]